MLELYCASQRWTVDVIADLGSGMNHHKKGLKCLLDSILDGQVGRLVLTHKDRLLRFGAELVFAMCQAREVEVVIINRDRTAASRKTWQMTYWRSSPCFQPGSTAAAATVTAS